MTDFQLEELELKLNNNILCITNLKKSYILPVNLILHYITQQRGIAISPDEEKIISG